jgi:hypothetical protein
VGERTALVVRLNVETKYHDYVHAV